MSDRLDEAARLHGAGRHEEAARLYEAILADRPGDLDALCRLGLICGQQGRFAEAEKYLGAALARNPALPL